MSHAYCKASPGTLGTTTDQDKAVYLLLGVNRGAQGLSPASIAL